MLIDEVELVVPEGKALKHKLDICTATQNLEKVRVVIPSCSTDKT